MIGGTKRIVSLLLTVLMLLSTVMLPSCNRRYDESEVLDAAKKLLKTAEMLNFVYHGDGIEYFESEGEIGYYRKANPAHLEKLGFKTIDELKTITEQTFSKRFTSSLYSTILSPLSDGTAIVSPARYYQAYDEDTNEPTYIMVYSKFEPILKSTIEYDYSTLRVDGSKKEKVLLYIDVTVTDADSQSKKTTVPVTLVEEDDGWRIDNPAYANYN